jgi:hypothetical protein
MESPLRYILPSSSVPSQSTSGHVMVFPPHRADLDIVLAHNTRSLAAIFQHFHEHPAFLCG